MSDPVIGPMPTDFAPALIQTDKVIAWRGRVSVVNPGSVETVDCEVGFPLSDPQARIKTLAKVWAVQQLAAQGRGDLIRWARKDRHAGHPVSSPIIVAATAPKI